MLVATVGEEAVQTFQLYVADARYSVPTLKIVVATDKEHARQLARQELLASRHHLYVDVREEDGPAFREERPQA